MGSASPVDCVAEGERDGLNDLARISWVGFVLHRSWKTCHDDRYTVGSIDYIDRDLPNVFKRAKCFRDWYYSLRKYKTQ